MLKGKIANLMQQAQQAQKNMQNVQEQLEKLEIIGQAGSNTVRVTMNGKHKIQRIEISDQAMNDREMLEDLLLIAYQDAFLKIEKIIKEKISNATISSSFPTELKFPF